MNKTGFLAASVLFLLLAGSVQAANICDSANIPAYPSYNSSMLLVITEATVNSKMSDISEPARVGWEARDYYDLSLKGWGGMVKFNDCWLCEFSGSTANFNGNCGTTPFGLGGQYKVEFFAKDVNDDVKFNKTILIHPQNMVTGVNIGDDGIVYVTADTPTNTEEVWITLYNAEDGEMLSSFNKVNMTAGAFPGRYFIEITSLEAGTYYAAFGFRTATGQTGGDLAKFTVSEEDIELTGTTDKSEYFLGETIVISGQTKYSQVSVSVKMPDGKIATGAADAVNQQYSYEFPLLGSYDEGDYQITLSAGDKEVTIDDVNVKKLVDVNPLSMTFKVTDKATPLERNITIGNEGNSTLSLSASTETITNYVTLDFDKKSLSSSSPSTLSVTLDPSTMTESESGKIIINAGSDVSIPVDVTITLDLPSNGGETSAGIAVTPALWSEDDCQAGEPLSKTFTIQNLGSAEVTDFGYSAGSGVSVTGMEPPDSVDGNGFGYLTLEVTPSSESVYGSVEITSSSGSSDVYVSMNCISDEMASDITALQDDVESLRESYDELFDTDTTGEFFSTIDDELSSASSSLESGNYALAKESYTRAMAMYDTIGNFYYEFNQETSVPNDDNSWLTWVAVIVVIAIIGVLGFFLYSKFGSKLARKGGDDEEEIEEELY